MPYGLTYCRIGSSLFLQCTSDVFLAIICFLPIFFVSYAFRIGVTLNHFASCHRNSQLRNDAALHIDLDRFFYKPDEENQAFTCSICMCDDRDEDPTVRERISLKCGHSFYFECAARWVLWSKLHLFVVSCPLCRNVVD